MQKSAFRPEVWEKVKDHLTPEALAEADVRVFSIQVTPDIGMEYRNFINQNDLCTFTRSKAHGRSIDHTYSPGFSVRLDSTGSLGTSRYTSCYLEYGAEGYKSLNAQEKARRCPTLNQIYFELLRDHPWKVLDVKFTETYHFSDGFVPNYSTHLLDDY